MFQTEKSSPGFTLVEILIAVVLLGVLMAFTLPKLFYVIGATSRYNKALAIAATIQELMDGYTNEIGECYPFLSCNVSASGNALDNLPMRSDSNDNPQAFLNLEAYIDTHLNYVNKFNSAGWSLYELPSKDIIALTQLSSGSYINTQFERNQMVWFYVFLDTNRAEYSAAKYTVHGVDTQQTSLFYVPRLHKVALGANGYNRLYAPNSYIPAYASIYDLKEHPEDTCESIYAGQPVNPCRWAGFQM